MLSMNGASKADPGAGLSHDRFVPEKQVCTGVHLASTGGMSRRAASASPRASSVWWAGSWLPLLPTRYSRYWQVSSVDTPLSNGSTASAGSSRPCNVQHPFSAIH